MEEIITKKKWWMGKVAYQIWPKSFSDGNGDGIGDLYGIIDKLDYLKQLGVDIIWISPLYRSPLVDQGYDISDYYDINPLFGDLDTMDRLIAEAKKRNIYIVMDLVVNHCSDEHEWFKKAMADPDGEYGRYFYIAEKKDGKLPCNWRSYFGGSVWEPIPGTDKYYLHSFHKKQPDLNWENPKLRKEIYKMINWWLDRGIAGFRLDAIINIKKKLPFKDYEPDRDDGLANIGKMLEEAEGVGEYLEEMKHETFEKYDALVRGLEDTKTLIEMAEEENDASLLPEIDSEITTFEEHLEELRIETLLSGEYDRSNAILTLHAGAGGTESCDWCQMLMRMYTRWAERKGYTTEVIDYLEGEEAGVKSVTIEISGPDAYGHLKSEHGVHRLVRISPFNAAGKRQTSFVSCDVMPDIDENIDIEINPDDLRIDTYRSSGAGGQHINKTSSAIRITHLPTGIVVQCQNERSQHQNKDKAMQMLKAKLYLLKQQENAEKTSDIRGDVKDINFGNQIRSYVLQPYTMVKDHRTNKDVGNAQSVLDGNIDPFINAYLIWLSTGKKAE